MKFIFKCVFSVLIFSIFCSVSFADDNPILLSYRRNFVRADIDTKADIVKDALKNTDTDMNLFFIDVLDYVECSYDLLKNDRKLLQMGIDAINSLSLNKYQDASYKIIYLFSKIYDDSFHIACLDAFKQLGVKDISLVEMLNEKYDKLFSLKLKGKDISSDLLKAYIKTIGAIGNSASFSVLFESLMKTKDITLKITLKNALNSISCDFFSEIVTIIEKKDIYYIWTAFELAKEKKDLPPKALGEITEMVLKLGFKNMKTHPKLSKDLIADCLVVVTDLKWHAVAPIVVSYFYKVQSDYKAGVSDVNDLIPVVRCMGMISSKESADSLAVFLGLLNSQVERGKPYDENLLITVIEALGELGDKTAFDYLLYVDYLDYSKAVKAKARNAISRLKW